MTPRNSAWLASSAWSLGAGVAVQQSRIGVSANARIRAVRVFPSKLLRMLDSSSTTAPKAAGSKRSSIS